MLNVASIDSVSPSSGSANGGTVLTIGGRGLVGDITVMVGDSQATVIGAAADGSITVLTRFSDSIGAANITISSSYMDEDLLKTEMYEFVEPQMLMGEQTLAVAGGEVMSVAFSISEAYDFDWTAATIRQGSEQLTYGNGINTVNTAGSDGILQVTILFTTLPKTAGTAITVQHGEFGDSDIKLIG